MTRSRSRRRRWRLAGLILSSLMCLAALDVEVSLLFFPKITLQRGGGSYILSDPLLGYGPRPDARARVTWKRFGWVIYDAHYGIDGLGRRLTQGAVDPEAHTVVFVGDSYTFGDGLNDAEALPQQYSQARGYRDRVINAAFSGYGPGQVLRLIDSARVSPQLGKGPRLFIYAAIDAQLGRLDPNALLHRPGDPLYRLEGQALRHAGTFHPGPQGALLTLAGKSAIVRGLRDLTLAAPSRSNAPLFGAVTQAAQAAARRRFGAAFLVVLWDEPVWQDGGNPVRASQRTAAVKAMADEMSRRGVAYVRVSALVPDYRVHRSDYVLAGSGHPSAALNRRLAAALAQRLSVETP